MNKDIVIEIKTTKSEARLLSDLIITATNGDFTIFNMLNDEAKIRFQVLANEIVKDIDDKEMFIILSKKIDNINVLSNKAKRCLKIANADTIGDIIKYSCEELMNIKNFGRKSIWEIESYLNEINLSLKKY